MEGERGAPACRGRVIIATYNRAESLRLTLESLLRMDVPPDLRWEIVVTDNNSRDHTRAVVAEIAARAAVPIRYLLEERQGKCFALNSAIAQGTGEYLLFIDDDVRVDRAWLREILWAFDTYRAGCVGGPIRLPRDFPVPPWLPDELMGAIGELNYGPAVLPLGPTDELFGANLALRRSVLEAIGLFPTNMGVGPGALPGEDSEMVERVTRAGHPAIYNPRAGVEHAFQPERLRKSYFRHWMFIQGQARALRSSRDTNHARRVPLFAVRRGLTDACRLLAALLMQDRKAAFYRQTRLWQAVGILWGWLRLRPSSAAARPTHRRAPGVERRGDS